MSVAVSEVRALLPLPATDELQLTESELANIVGSPIRRLQIDWLSSNGWVFFRTRGGRLVVGRLYANLKLAGIDAATLTQRTEWLLNMAAIS